ncbi:GNAT family N-acetyltransferase [Candidatus Micrarchaeota archaeon]|nr:GNAT family N-acetyltransferase [Candidatus Micrarchaeota archaeon]MBU2476508.1 GNAT family N-acetyltransferase [Candidatus Micrarchaeota archaeon]
MQIKKVQDELDVKRGVNLFVEVMGESPYFENWSKEDAEKRLMHSFSKAKDFAFFAEENGKAIGLLFCATYIWDDGIHVFVEDLYVDKEFRGKGAAKNLVEALEKTAKEKGIVVIDLFAHTQAKAFDFWKKMGYKQTHFVQMQKKL